MAERLHVAVGVVQDVQQKILIAQRPVHLHQGGLWEFPGGKVEPDEPVTVALARELKEELNLEVNSADCQPLIQIDYDYPDRQVLLDVFRVLKFQGEAIGMEGQSVRWVDPNRLNEFTFPAANRPIIHAAQLPDRYAILDDADDDCVRQQLDRLLEHGVQLIQLRLKRWKQEDVHRLLNDYMPQCRERKIKILINSDVEGDYANQVDGIHLTSRALNDLSQRPLNYEWVAASCHTEQELHQAQALGIDFAVLAPVLSTATHPNAQPLGWEWFARLAAMATVPVYALGGMSLDCLAYAQQYGAQGIAGIRNIVPR